MAWGFLLPSERDAVGESWTTLFCMMASIGLVIVFSLLGHNYLQKYEGEKGKWLDANALYGVELRAKKLAQTELIETYYLYRDTKAQLGECEYLLKSYLSEKQ